MIRQCFLAKTGIQFYRETFKHIGLDPITLLGDRDVNTRPSALKISSVAEAKYSAECRDDSANHAALHSQAHVQASPKAACTFISEEYEELLDALSTSHDQLKETKAWWILEMLPLRHSKQDREDSKFPQQHYWEYVFFTPNSLPLSLMLA
jgi:hypothetical protein